MRIVVPWPLGILAVSIATPVHAQSLFVDLGAFAGIERRLKADISPDDSSISEADISGTVAGGTVAVGGWMGPQVSVRLELAFPAALEAAHEQSIVYPVLAGPTIAYSERREHSERIRSFSTLVGYHTSRRNGVQIVYLGGAAFLTRRRTNTYSFTFPSAATPIPVGSRLLPSQTTTITDYTVRRRSRARRRHRRRQSTVGGAADSCYRRRRPERATRRGRPPAMVEGRTTARISMNSRRLDGGGLA